MRAYLFPIAQSSQRIRHTLLSRVKRKRDCAPQGEPRDALHEFVVTREPHCQYAQSRKAVVGLFGAGSMRDARCSRRLDGTAARMGDGFG